ncbi:MAG: FAD-dependent oxidoreductase [Clostridiales bacterium]|nr:FAD-dependent oxidoreductase [Clostridiales bacterium]
MALDRVVVIGAGPAGIFAALELSRLGGFEIIVVEKGKNLAERRCPARERGCVSCPTCDIMTGWGGAGAFSDGKLTLTGEVGGWLGDYIGTQELDTLIGYVDGLWCEFGASKRVYTPDPNEAKRLERAAELAGMHLTPMRIRHLGTDRSPKVLDAARVNLLEHGVRILTETAAKSVVAKEGRVTGVELEDGTTLHAGAVIAAPGREGADWLTRQAALLGIGRANNAVDIGVRVEVPATVMEPLTDHLYEAKLTYRSRSFGDKVRTFCMNPYGEVTAESYGDVITVNGHSYADDKTDRTNFAVLVSQAFTYPFREPTTYGRSIARLANLLGEGILVQRLGDLMAGRRSTPERIAESTVMPTMATATPGDLSNVVPYRHLTGILEFLEALDVLAPGVNAPGTLLYGIEVKFYSSKLEVGPDLQTSITGLYAIGDGAGVTRGLIQSSASGVVAARAIAAAR